MSLAAAIIPLIAEVLDCLTLVVEAMRDHPQTEDELKIHLQGMSEELRVINGKLQAVELPDA